MKTTHPIYDVYFRIEAGYHDGRMSPVQHARFYTEIRALFSRAGFTILENSMGCPSFQLGTTCLYCHPTELSGTIEEPHIALVENLLKTGRSFQYLTTDRITQLYDFTVEEELAYYRQQISEQLFLEAFRSPGPTRYHLREEVLEELVRQLMVPTVRTPIGCSFASPCMCVVRETYASLVQRGLLIEIQRRKPYGTMTHKLLRMPALRALFPTGR